MTEFVYRRVVDGAEIAEPGLAQHLETMFPGHCRLFHRILEDFGITGWKVAFQPSSDLFSGVGALLKPLKLIIVANHLVKEEVLVTFYHEIIHLLYPSLREEWVEEMACQWYIEDYYKIKVKEVG